MTAAATAAAAGFLLGASLILAVGAQNAFVLRQGLRREHVLAVCMVCIVSDWVLIAVGVTGFGALADRVPGLVPALRWGGAAFLAVYGVLALRAAWRGGEALEPAGGAAGGSLRAALLTCLALTWLNPHVYLDTVVLLGSVSTGYEDAAMAFGAGAGLASLLFFLALGYGAALLRPVFARPAAWRALDGLVGATMLGLAAKLALG